MSSARIIWRQMTHHKTHEEKGSLSEMAISRQLSFATGVNFWMAGRW
jgi:hypothetical protein